MFGPSLPRPFGFCS